MGNLKGPLIYDSLDKPNKQDEPRDIPRSSNSKINNASMAVVLSGIMVITIFIIYVLMKLEYKAANYDTFSIVALYIIYTAAIFAIITVFIGMSWYAVQYLRRLVKTKGMFSLQNGPYYDVENMFTREQFDRLAELMYTVQQERARNSKYQGVQTLTLDESQSQTNTLPKTPDTTTTKSPTDDKLQSFGLGMLDTLND